MDDPKLRPWTSLIVVMCASMTLSAQRPLFTSGVDLVHMNVSVVDGEGRLVDDLTVADVELYEDGELQEIRYFARGLNSDTETMPMHLGLLFDASDSMGADGRFAKTAAIKFINALTYAEDMTLVDFGDEVRVGRYGQADLPRLVQRIRNLEADGMTSFYDALGVYLDGAFFQDGRKVLLMYSDGDDTRSRMRFSETLELLKASDVTIYAIGFQKHLRSSVWMRQRLRLEQLVEITGGRCFFPSDVAELDDVYAEIALELETRYAIGYTSTNQRSDGTWRRVEIKVKPTRPELEKVEVRSRDGYFALYREPDAVPDR